MPSEPRPRYAAFDIGTNTLKMVIAERDGSGAFTRVLDTARTTRLGESPCDGRLRESAMRRTLEALAELVPECRRYGAAQIAAVGTAALRDAVNREEFVGRARELGVPLEVISGEEEARLSFLAVRRDPNWRDADRLLVMDIGGGSTEVVFGESGGAGIESRTSVPVGAVRLTEGALRSDPPTLQQIADASARASAAVEGLTREAQNYTAVGVGGTFVNMAAVHLKMPEQDPERLHGRALTMEDVEAQVKLYAERTIEERRRVVGLDPARADIIPAGAIILRETMQRLGLEQIAVSCRGLRWGVLYDRFG